MPYTPTPPAIDRPAHYRLSTETWLLILKEYREGATAPYLARKWRVSQHAIRKRATQHGSTKRDWGDRQAIAIAVAREAELEEARRNSPEAVAARLFHDIPAEMQADGAGPDVLSRLATLASGRAMRGRLWSEARALAGLAETYQKLAERQEAGTREMRAQTAPLELIHEIRNLDPGVLSERFRIHPDTAHEDPHLQIKQAYWAAQAQVAQQVQALVRQGAVKARHRGRQTDRPPPDTDRPPGGRSAWNEAAESP